MYIYRERYIPYYRKTSLTIEGHPLLYGASAGGVFNLRQRERERERESCSNT